MSLSTLKCQHLLDTVELTKLKYTVKDLLPSNVIVHSGNANTYLIKWKKKKLKYTVEALLPDKIIVNLEMSVLDTVEQTKLKYTVKAFLPNKVIVQSLLA